jgi:hypothetical protein
MRSNRAAAALELGSACHRIPANISGTACYHFATQFGSTRQNQAGRADIAASNCADNSVLRDTGWYRTMRGYKRISSAVLSTTQPPLRGRQRPKDVCAGYVSNAGPLNKGGRRRREAGFEPSSQMRPVEIATNQHELVSCLTLL